MNFEDQLPKLISLKNLLNFFDIDLELPSHLMELQFDECLKSSELNIVDGVYKYNGQKNCNIQVSENVYFLNNS